LASTEASLKRERGNGIREKELSEKTTREGGRVGWKETFGKEKRHECLEKRERAAEGGGTGPERTREGETTSKEGDGEEERGWSGARGETQGRRNAEGGGKSSILQIKIWCQKKKGSDNLLSYGGTPLSSGKREKRRIGERKERKRKQREGQRKGEKRKSF